MIEVEEHPSPTVTLNLTVVVFTIENEKWQVEFGQLNEPQFNSVLQTLTRSFETVRTNSSFTLVDVNGLVHIFNVNNITCIQIERR